MSFVLLVSNVQAQSLATQNSKQFETQIITPPKDEVTVTLIDWGFRGIINFRHEVSDLTLYSSVGKNGHRFHCDSNGAWIEFKDQRFYVRSQRIQCENIYMVLKSISEECPLKMLLNKKHFSILKIEATCPVEEVGKRD